MSPSECSTSDSRWLRKVHHPLSSMISLLLLICLFLLTHHHSFSHPGSKPYSDLHLLPFHNLLWCISYWILPILPLEFFSSSSSLPLWPWLSSWSVCDQAVDIAGCLAPGHSPPFLLYQQTPLAMIETENPDAFFPSLLCSKVWPYDLVLANITSEEAFWEGSGLIFLPLLTCRLPLVALLAILNSLLPTCPPPLPFHANYLLNTFAKSSLENSFDQVIFLLSTTPPSNARESLQTFSLACKAFQDLVLTYLSYFLPWDLLSYPSAWPKGDKCFPCVLVQVLQSLEEQVVRKKETDLHWPVLLPCSRWPSEQIHGMAAHYHRVIWFKKAKAPNDPLLPGTVESEMPLFAEP